MEIKITLPSKDFYLWKFIEGMLPMKRIPNLTHLYLRSHPLESGKTALEFLEVIGVPIERVRYFGSSIELVNLLSLVAKSTLLSLELLRDSNNVNIQGQSPFNYLTHLKLSLPNEFPITPLLELCPLLEILFIKSETRDTTPLNDHPLTFPRLKALQVKNFMTLEHTFLHPLATYPSLTKLGSSEAWP